MILSIIEKYKFLKIIYFSPAPVRAILYRENQKTMEEEEDYYKYSK